MRLQQVTGVMPVPLFKKETHMESRGPEVHVEENAARAGSTPHIVRYVLLISLALAIVALSAIWITGAVSSDDDTGGAADSAQAAREQAAQE